MLILYHHDISPPSRAALMVIRNLGLEVEIRVVDLFKMEHHSEEFLKVNPLHQLPVLVDGDLVITESRAIAAYLVNSKAPGNSLYPTDPAVRALVDSRLYFDATVVFPRNCDALYPVYYHNSKVISKDHIKKIDEYMVILETFLNGKKWFAGDDPTIADISILSCIAQTQICGYNITKTPNMKAWYENCKKLPGFDELYLGSVHLGEFFKSKNVVEGF